MTSSIYAGGTMIAAFGWPCLLYESLPQPYFYAALLANAVVAATTWHQCSSREYSLFGGFQAIAGSMMSGCANITLIYLPLLMTGVYLACVFFSIGGLLHGRGWAQGRFLRVVEWFLARHLRTPLDPVKHLEPTDPATLKVDPHDPESILHAAALWDHQGDWDRALEMYRLVRDSWPEEHGHYAGNCIEEIERKMSLGQGE
ncbi:MAG: hypothetical protein U0800_25485 [Isosphaeraceae bacterium]